MPPVDLDTEFLDLFYSITNDTAPSDPTLIQLKKQLINVVDLFKELNKNAKKPIASKALGDSNQLDVTEPAGPAILVVDDLGVITYQLKVLLSQFDLEVECSQEIYDAVNKYKKRKYEYIIMDLFIPTEREGFILLTELKKMSAAFGVNTVIGVITASPRKEIEQQCKARGADFFLEKNNDWQTELFNKMNDYIKENGGIEEEDY